MKIIDDFQTWWLERSKVDMLGDGPANGQVREPAAQHTETVDDYRRMSSDFCTRCGLLVHVEAIVLVDGENRPLVRCPQDHLEAQR